MTNIWSQSEFWAFFVAIWKDVKEMLDVEKAETPGITKSVHDNNLIIHLLSYSV